MPPVVVVGFMHDTQRAGRQSAEQGVNEASLVADWMYVGEDAALWSSDYGTMPCFAADEMDALRQCEAEVKFLSLTYRDLNEDVLRFLETDRSTVVVFYSVRPYFVGEARAFMHRLLDAACDVPVILRRDYEDADPESLQIKAAADLGALLTDGFGDGILLGCTSPAGIDAQTLVNYMFGILQAARVRISKTEYISCPGCGRTLFHLQQTIAQVKAATSHLKGLKIAIMGCIVNGPGEMADADYGYVGAGRGRVNLYKGKACVRKNIPEEEAVAQLLELISNY